MRIAALVLVAFVAAAALPACSANCEDACANYGRVCASEFQASGLDFDVEGCTDACEANLEGCGNELQRESCLAGASSCDEARSCPGCSG